MSVILKPSQEFSIDPKQLEIEALMVDYINRIIKFDIILGRSNDNFFKEDFKSVSSNIEKFKKEGFRVFIGGGNIFFLKIDKKLTGWQAICVQSRGMARRKIMLKEMPNA